MKPPRSISVMLSLVLALVAVPGMGDCAMAEAAGAHPSPAADIDRDGDSDSDSEHCHDPAPSPDRAQTLDCPDCFEHCRLQSQAGLLANARTKFAAVGQPELPPSRELHPADAAPQLFRPPALVPRTFV